MGILSKNLELKCVGHDRNNYGEARLLVEKLICITV